MQENNLQPIKGLFEKIHSCHHFVAEMHCNMVQARQEYVLGNGLGSHSPAVPLTPLLAWWSWSIALPSLSLSRAELLRGSLMVVYPKSWRTAPCHEHRGSGQQQSVAWSGWVGSFGDRCSPNGWKLLVPWQLLEQGGMAAMPVLVLCCLQ